MATMNHFDLLGVDDAEDPSLLIAAAQQKLAAAPKKVPAQNQGKPASQPQPQQNKPPAKLPSKPAPPSQAGESFYWRFIYLFEFLCVLGMFVNNLSFFILFLFGEFLLEFPVLLLFLHTFSILLLLFVLFY